MKTYTTSLAVKEMQMQFKSKVQDFVPSDGKNKESGGFGKANGNSDALWVAVCICKTSWKQLGTVYQSPDVHTHKRIFSF